MSAQDNVVIVGAGHAGFQLASSLRQIGFAGSVRLINGEPHLPYQRPPLTKAYLLGDGQTSALNFRDASFFRDRRIELVPDSAVAIDRKNRSLRLSSGVRIPYANLVLALGAQNRQLRVADACPGVVCIRQLGEAEYVRRRLLSARRAVVVGGGFIGLEFACAARVRGLEVDVVEVAPRVMERAVRPVVSRHFEDRHAQAGIRFHCGAALKEITRTNDSIEGVVLTDGRVIPADLIVVGIGVIPNVQLAVDAALEVGDGIVVDSHLRSSDPSISAIGDCACFCSRYAPAPTRIESVQNATDQARCVAARLHGSPRPYDSVPWFWSDQGSAKLQIAGITHASDAEVLRGTPTSGSFSVFCYREGRLIGIESVNRPADHMLGRKMLAMGRTIDPEAAADVGLDLKRLAL